MRTYKTFEANRLGEIDELTRIDEWRYVPTKPNVADSATRETFNPTLYSEWLAGPTFLHWDDASWPRDITQLETNVACEEVTAVLQEHSVHSPVPDPVRFSSWLRFLRASAAVFKFVDRLKGLPSSGYSVQMMERAERQLLKHAQEQSFAEDLAAIRNGKVLSKNSRLLILSPFLDKHSLLRVGGRIDAAADVAMDV